MLNKINYIISLCLHAYMHVWKLTYVSWRISIAIHQTVTVSEKNFPSLMKNVYLLFNLQCYHYNLPRMTSAAKNEEAILYIFLFKWGWIFFPSTTYHTWSNRGERNELIWIQKHHVHDELDTEAGEAGMVCRSYHGLIRPPSIQIVTPE